MYIYKYIKYEYCINLTVILQMLHVYYSSTNVSHYSFPGPILHIFGLHLILVTSSSSLNVIKK